MTLTFGEINVVSQTTGSLFLKTRVLFQLSQHDKVLTNLKPTGAGVAWSAGAIGGVSRSLSSGVWVKVSVASLTHAVHRCCV